MREPRSKQLFPTGGKNLYELLRSDYEPASVDVFVEDECQRGRDKEEATLTYRRNFDPMLYFWPVEGQYVHIHLNARPADLERLSKALLRDGAAVVVAVYPNNKKTPSFYSEEWNTHDDADVYAYEFWGDADGFMQRRYGPAAMDTVAVPGRGSGADREGAEAGPADSGGVPDGQRENTARHGAPLESPGTGDDGDVYGAAARTAATNRP